MAIVTVPEFVIPYWRSSAISGTGIAESSGTVATLDGASDALMWVGDPPVSGNIEEFYWRTGTTSVTAGPLNFDGRIEQLTNLRPNGTLWAANTNGAVAVADTDDNVWKTCTLTSSAAVTVGTPFGLVIKAPGSGTFSMTVVGKQFQTGMFQPPVHFPLASVDTNGDGTYDSIITAHFCLAVKISGVIYSLYGTNPWNTIGTATYNSGSSPDAKALRFTLSAPVRVCGMRAYVHNVAAGADFTYSIFPNSASSQTDGDAVAQVSTDGDGASSTSQDNWLERRFSSAPTLAAGTVYWAEVRADTANSITLAVLAYPSITGIGAAGPGGADMYLGTRTWTAGSAPAYSTDTGNMPLIELICNGIDAGGSSGGMIIHPGMNGGLRG